MLSASALLSLILLASTATLASPTISPKRTFSIAQRSSDALPEHGAYAMRKAYRKYGLPLPAGLAKRQFAPAAVARPQLTTTVPAASEFNDVEYLSPVMVGDTTLQLDFDTGSSDLWVFSDRLPESMRAGHGFYATLPPSNRGITSIPTNTRRITGVEKRGFSWDIKYGDGTGASGLVYSDTVRVGDVVATNQAVEVATTISAQFTNEKSDGILGLGFGSSNTVKPVKQKTWFENVKGQLREPLFTVALKKNATGTYDFGFIDPAKHDGEIQYVPVNSSRGYWEYTATGYAVGNAAAAAPMQFQAIADTGTTLLLLPPPIPSNYYAQVPGARYDVKEGGYVYPCASAALMPALSLFVGGNVRAVVPPALLDRGASLTGSGKCFGGLQSSGAGLSIWGDVFLKSQFMVFRGSEPPMLGFAQQRMLASPLAPAAAVPAVPAVPIAPLAPLVPTSPLAPSLPGFPAVPVSPTGPVAPVGPSSPFRGPPF